MSALKIFIDRLKNGTTLKIDERVGPEFLGPDEEELKFCHDVSLKGETYLTDQHLIIHLDASTLITMPCKVCNELTEKELKVKNFYYTQPIEEIDGAIFDMKEPLREALLIELPKTIECNDGRCPERLKLSPYMREGEERTNFPFANMDQEINEEN